eukprot:2326439-Rhodomonas_salina.1
MPMRTHVYPYAYPGIRFGTWKVESPLPGAEVLGGATFGTNANATMGSGQGMKVKKVNLVNKSCLESI